MIRSKEELRLYLEEDRLALGHKKTTPGFLGDEEWKFQRALRYQEYYYNCGQGFFSRLAYFWFKFYTHHLSVKLGFTISINTCGPGLQLPHRGTIIINDQAKIGKNCRIHACVNIGAHKGKAPKIGDNVYIGPGAKLFGDIVIADNVKIGANAVVNRSFETPGARIVSPSATELPSESK